MTACLVHFAEVASYVGSPFGLHNATPGWLMSTGRHAEDPGYRAPEWSRAAGLMSRAADCWADVCFGAFVSQAFQGTHVLKSPLQDT